MSSFEVRNGRVDVEVPTDEDAKQCARLLKDPHSSIKSVDLRRGLVTSAGAGAIAKALKGESTRSPPTGTKMIKSSCWFGGFKCMIPRVGRRLPQVQVSSARGCWFCMMMILLSGTAVYSSSSSAVVCSSCGPARRKSLGGDAPLMIGCAPSSSAALAAAVHVQTAARRPLSSFVAAVVVVV